MLNQQEYRDLLKELRFWGLDVFISSQADLKVTYRTLEFPNILFHITKYMESYKITTFFNKTTCATLEEVFEIIRYEWNKDNWIYGQDHYGAYIELRTVE